jgi:hypothetical protein
VIKLCQKLHVGKQKHGDQGNPDLRHDRITAGTKKGFDLQVLLEPFEKELHLPAAFINISDGFGRQMEVVGINQFIN